MNHETHLSRRLETLRPLFSAEITFARGAGAPTALAT